MLIEEAYTEEIDLACLHLKNSVNSIQIINWLNNFERGEWDNALLILSKIKYYSVADIQRELDTSLNNAFQSIPAGGIIYIHAIGKYGKSGSAMIYFLQKTKSFVKFPKKNIVIIEEVSHFQNIPSGSDVILLDDIIGSGGSTIEYYNNLIKPILSANAQTLSFQIVCIAYLRMAVSKLQSTIIGLKIHGDISEKVFSYDRSLFGSRLRMIKVRKFCHKYGSELYKDNALGYKNSQALIVFAHASPNNTLPIIWSDRSLKSTGKPWYPLYPRAAEIKVSQLKAIRDDAKIWVYYAYKHGLIPHPNTPSIPFSQVDYQIITIIMLKNKRLDTGSLCQQLGMSLHEYKTIIQSGIAKGIFDKFEQLTPNGKILYRQMKSNIRGLYNNQKSTLPLTSYTTYVPDSSWKRT